MRSGSRSRLSEVYVRVSRFMDAFVSKPHSVSGRWALECIIVAKANSSIKQNALYMARNLLRTCVVCVCRRIHQKCVRFPWLRVKSKSFSLRVHTRRV